MFVRLSVLVGTMSHRIPFGLDLSFTQNAIYNLILKIDAFIPSYFND